MERVQLTKAVESFSLLRILRYSSAEDRLHNNSLIIAKVDKGVNSRRWWRNPSERWEFIVSYI